MSDAIRTGLSLVGRPHPGASRKTRVNATVSATGLTIEDTLLGEGAAAAPGQLVDVHYTGWLAGGRKFDSSREREEAFKFVLDSGDVIPGWDEGVLGMKVGGQRRLVIPPHLGFGEQGAGSAVPPNATLVFDIELLGLS